MINGTLYLVPAYGRTYATLEQLKADWEDGKDFKVASGPYCSIRDLEALRSDYDYVKIVYAGCPDLVLVDKVRAI